MTVPQSGNYPGIPKKIVRLLEIGIPLLIVTVAVLIVVLKSRSAQIPDEVLPPTDPFPLSFAEVRGSPMAPVTVVVLSDFACQFCAAFARTSMAELERAVVDTGLASLAFHQATPCKTGHGHTAAIAAQCASRGFTSAHNGRAAEALGVRRVVLPAQGRKSPTRRTHERQRWFRRGQRWRTGCEGRISVVKRRHGLRRSRYRGADGIHRWVGLGVIADNLINIAAFLDRRVAA